ncbi:MAG: choice-of-anchor D domain-containing protein [Bacteroidota bacterium]|nr:choice-of-anchor D domain-containing protein [Bacteroidota bacterium]
MRTRASLLALMVMAVAMQLWGGQGRPETEEEIRSKLLTLLANDGGAAGTDFCFSFPPCFADESGGCVNRIMLYIASAVRARVIVEVEGTGYQRVLFTAPYVITPLEMNPGNAQPYEKRGNEPAPPEQVYPGKAIRIRSTAPIVVYGVTRFCYTSDSFLAYPLRALGKEYIIASMADMTWMYPGYNLPSLSVIAAPYDNTRVTVTLGGNANTETSGGLRPGQTRTWVLNRNDVLALATGNTAGREGDLSGTLIRATKPVAVISGNQCANVPTDIRWCDFIADMEIPTDMWGKVLLVPRVPTRRFAPMVKIFAKEPQTRIFRNGSYWRNIQTKGGTEGVGFIYDRATASGNNEIVVFSGDKPIGATFFNTGQEDDWVVSDPFQMTIYPLEQFQREVIFCTPGSQGTPRFDQNYVAIVFPLTEAGTMPPDLEWGVMNGGRVQWQPLAAAFGPSVGDVYPITVNGKRYAVKVIRIEDGVYRIRCSQPFAAYSFGFSNYDSYGHPTSAAFAVQLPDTIPPRPRFIVNCDGTVSGTSGGDADVTDYPDDDAIRANLAEIYLDPASRNYTLDYDPFEVGTSRSTRWRLTVDDPDQDAIAYIVFRDRANNDTVIVVEYKARRITLQPSDVDFGMLRKGDVATRTIDVVNEGSSPVRVTRLEFKNGGQGVFEIVNNPIPFDLQPGERRTITIRYTATNDGTVRDSIGVGDECVFRYRRLVVGQTGEPIIDVSHPVARPLDFGDVGVGTTANRTFTVFSRGTVRLTITGAQGPTDPVFVPEPALRQISAATPLILSEQGGGNDSKTYTISFTPTAEQVYTATITFSSDARRIDSVVHIRGRGVKPGLSVSPLDFGEKRINPTNPYNLLADWQTVAAFDPRNDGTQSVTISAARITQDRYGNGAAFTFNPPLDQLPVVDIPPGRRLSDVLGRPIYVFFSPQATGPHEVTVTFENSTGEPRSATVTGVGIAPKVTITPTVTFGPVESGSGVRDVKQVTVTNLSRQDWEYADTLHLFDLVAEVDGTIGMAAGVYGSENFSFDKSDLNLPRVLLPGQSITFDAEYMVNTPGVNITNTATLVTVSDALEEARSVWTGRAYSGVAKITVSPASGQVCVGSTTNLTVRVTNTGDVPITSLTFVRMVGQNATMFGAPTNLPLPNPIPKGGTYDLIVPFTPSQPGGPFTAQIVLQINGKTDEEYRGDLSGTGLQQTTLVVGVSETFDIPQGVAVAPKLVRFQAKSPVTMGSVTSFTMRVTIDITVFDFVKQNGQPVIQVLGPLATAGWTVTNASVTYDQANSRGIAEFTLVGTTPLRVQTDEYLFGIELTAALPGILPTAGGYPVQLETVAANDQCVVITTQGATMRINPVCAFNLRLVRLEGTTFNIQVNPNPVNGAGADVHFGVGYDAPTTIDLVNTSGVTVATLVHDNLKTGSYTVRFVPNGIASGSYLLRMRSGDYTQTIPVVIEK